MDVHTRAGASTASPAVAAAVLRAIAARHGATLVPVPTTHLAAAVCAVEAWMAAYAASSLDSPSHYGADAASTLAIALSLAASGIEPVQGISGDCAPYEPFASLLVRMSEWIVAWFGDPIDRYTAATLAASCLTASPDPQLASLGELLVCWAEEFTLD